MPTQSNEQRRLKNVEKSRKWRAENKERSREYARQWKLGHPGYWLDYKYGITPEELEALHKSQNYLCAICKTDTPTKKGWHTDHDHETGAVRGVLCHHCNHMLGNARDNPAILLAGAQYLGN